jgi:isoaspartyl peptidase/L-asparaginase-like protein (Ntn-hydrolase superfamily)
MSESPQTNAPETGGSMTPLQRVLMDRAREQAALAQVKPPRRPFQTVLSIVLALAAVLIIGGAINAFLASMQIAMHTMDEQEKKEAAAREAEQRKAPMPAYVVPAEEQKKQ